MEEIFGGAPSPPAPLPEGEGRIYWGRETKGEVVLVPRLLAALTAKTEIRVMPEAMNRARDFLNNKPEAEEHLDRVKKLIEGFETPYGMELLSTVHWVVKHGECPVGD